MSETTTISTFINGCVNHINTYILTPIVSYLNTKGMNVSVEELSQQLQLPVSKINVPLINTISQPTISANFIKKNIANTPTKSCRYQYKRGKDKGQFCPKPAVTGYDYCNTCLKRNSLIKDSTTEYPTNSNGLFNNGTPQGQLNVVEYDSERNLYKELSNNFIVCQVRPGVIATIGYLDGNEILPLTQEQKTEALKIGLVVSDKITDE